VSPHMVASRSLQGSRGSLLAGAGVRAAGALGVGKDWRGPHW
jgi:hypothetical protein